MKRLYLLLAGLAVLSACTKIPNIPANEVKLVEFFGNLRREVPETIQLSNPWHANLPLNWDYLDELEEFQVFSDWIPCETNCLIRIIISFSGIPGSVSRDGRLILDARRAAGKVSCQILAGDVMTGDVQQADYILSGSLRSNDSRMSLLGSLAVVATNTAGKSFKLNIQEIKLFNLID